MSYETLRLCSQVESENTLNAGTWRDCQPDFNVKILVKWGLAALYRDSESKQAPLQLPCHIALNFHPALFCSVLRPFRLKEMKANC